MSRRTKKPLSEDHKSYTFVVEGTISLHVTVQATSLEEAVQLAQEASTMGLCHQCAHESPGEWSTSGELDCDPPSSPLVGVYVDDEDVQGPAFLDMQQKWSDQ